MESIRNILDFLNFKNNNPLEKNNFSFLFIFYIYFFFLLQFVNDSFVALQMFKGSQSTSYSLKYILPLVISIIANSSRKWYKKKG